MASDSRERPPAQLRLKADRRGREQESEANCAVASLDGVVKPVRLLEALQIASARHPAKAKTLMNQHIVNEKVDGAVEGYAQSPPPERLQPESRHEQPDDSYRKAQSIEIVLFDRSRWWPMVGAVPPPAPAVHYIFMRCPSKALHEQHHAKGHSKFFDPRHELALAHFILIE